MAKASTVGKQNSSGFVTVACKLPNGFLIRTFNMVATQEMVMGGGVRETKVAERTDHEPVRIYGPAVPFGQRSPVRIVAGYALTPRVPFDVWESWLKDNEKSAMVKNGIVFAYERTEDAVAHAKDGRAVRSGMEPVNPDGDPRAPKRIKKMTGRAAEDEEEDALVDE